MNMMRTDLQAALNDLYVLVQESVDHYQDVAEFIEDDAAASLLKDIAEKRSVIGDQLEGAIRETGDLPSSPDADREAGYQLVQRLKALFSADQTQDILVERLEAETDLATRLNDLRDGDLQEPFQTLLGRLQQDVATAEERLRKAIEG